MKRINLLPLLLALLLLFSLLLSACSSPQFPMTEQHEKFGRKALEIADAYLDFEITADEAYQKISDLYDARDSLPEGTSDQKTGNLIVESEVFLLESAFWAVSVKNSGLATAVDSDVLGSRNKLAETLGVKAR